MGAGNSGEYKNTKGALKPEHLIEELRQSGVKFTEKNIVMITKNKKNKLIWLENGDGITGLMHILNRHGEEFLKIGISYTQIPNVLKEAIKTENIVGVQGKNNKSPRFIYEIEVDGNKKYIAISISKNGYIVGANPSGKGSWK